MADNDLPVELDYQAKLRAIGDKRPAMHVEQNPDNASSFVSSTGKMQFIVEANQHAKFADLRNAYVACDIRSSVADATCDMGSNGTIACASRVVLSTNTNQIISEIYKKNILDCALNTMTKSGDWYDSTGSILYGTSSNFGGNVINISGDAKSRYIIPLDKLGLDDVYYPLGGKEDLKIEIYLESAINVAIGDTGVGSIVATSLTFTDCILHYDVLALHDAEYEQMLQMTGGKFVLTSRTYHTQDKIITAANTTDTMQIGAGKRNVKRVIVVQRDTVNDDTLLNNYFAMGTGACSQISLMHNSMELKNRPYTIYSTGAPENYAEFVKSMGASVYDNVESIGYRARYDLDGDTAATDLATSGTFLAVFDCVNGFETEDTSSGINITTGSTMLKLTRTATGSNFNLEVFLEYEQELVLDFMAGGRLAVLQ